MKRGRWLFLLHIPLSIVGATMLLPLMFMITVALANPDDAMKATDNVLEMIIPQSWHWENFAEVSKVVPFVRYYLNSLTIALIVTAGQVFTSACAAYAFARLEWKGRDTLFLAYLATMMVPGAVTMLPNFIAMKSGPEIFTHLFSEVDWKAIRHFGETVKDPMFGRLLGQDSYFALTIPAMFSAYGTFMLRQFFLGIPKELDEAAEIDGCTHWQIFTKMIIPLSKPALASKTIFTFMGAWGSFLWPLVMTNQDQLRTLPLGLQAFQGQYSTQWHLLMAASLLMLLPIVIIFLVGQRFFVSGMTVGAVKG
jgi:multiple sugar transport system permease protein